MPEPLHIPPMVTFLPESSTSTAASFSWVSVVIIASAALCPLVKSPLNFLLICSTPAQIRSIGSCFPITPVDATRTASSGISINSEVFFAVSLQYPNPSVPVHALAIPAFTTTACANALFFTMSLSHFTGAAFTTFVVKVPATAHGSVE